LSDNRLVRVLDSPWFGRIRNRLARVLDWPWFGRIRNALWLLGPPLALASFVVGVVAVAWTSFPLLAQIGVFVGTLVTVALILRPAARAVGVRRTMRLRAAMHDLLEELATMRVRVGGSTSTDSHGSTSLAYDFHLPAIHFEEHKRTLTEYGLDATREMVGAVYVKADEWNRVAQRAEDSVELEEADVKGLEAFGRSIRIAADRLREDLRENSRDT
jgi:hypothetical protein